MKTQTDTLERKAEQFDRDNLDKVGRSRNMGEKWQLMADFVRSEMREVVKELRTNGVHGGIASNALEMAAQEIESKYNL